MSKFIYLVLCCTLFGCLTEKDEILEQTKSQVTVINPTKQLYEKSFDSFGSISYKKKNNVTAFVSGYLEKIYYKEGDFVKKGAILGLMKNVQLEIQIEQAKMDCEIAENNYEQALLRKKELLQNIETQFIALEKDSLYLKQKNNELEFLQENLKKQKELLHIGGISEESYKQLVFDVEKLENEIKVFEKEMEITYFDFSDENLRAFGLIPAEDENSKKEQIITVFCENIENEIKKCLIESENARKNYELHESLKKEMILYAPISGIVVNKHFEKGEFIQEKEIVFTVIPSDDLVVIISIQEKDRNKISYNTKLKVKVDSLNYEFETIITEISPLVDAETSTFFVKAQIAREIAQKTKLVPGMFVYCRISLGERQELFTIPEKCLIDKNEESISFFVVKNNVLVKKSSTSFYIKDGLVYLGEGVNADEQVVCNPQIYFWEGQYVEIM